MPQRSGAGGLARVCSRGDIQSLDRSGDAGVRLLVVDDAAADREQVHRLAERLPGIAPVVGAANVAEALAATDRGL